MRDIAAALNYILRLNLKGSWIIDLLEVTGEVTLMVVFPFYQATNLICELGIANIATCFVHSALVASLHCRCLRVIPQTATLVASLMVEFTADDVED